MITKELKSGINKKETDLLYWYSLREIQNEFRKAKRKHLEKTEVKYSSGDLRAALQGIKNMASVNQYANETKNPLV